MAEEFVIKIVDDAASAVKNTVNKSNTSSGSGGGLIGGTAKIGGIIAIASEILSLVKEAVSGILKPVKVVVLSILKLVAQFLRPIADIIILLLQPVLMFLKPIIKVFNEVMRPFRTLAYSLMKQGNEMGGVGGALLNQLAITTIFAGLSNAILAVIGELLKFLISVLLDMIKTIVIFPILEITRPILEFFGADVDAIKENINGSFNDAKTWVNGAIDEGLATIQTLTLTGILGAAKGIITGTNGEGMGITDALKMLEDTATTTIGSASEKVRQRMQDAINNMFNVNIPQKKWDYNAPATHMSPSESMVRSLGQISLATKLNGG